MGVSTTDGEMADGVHPRAREGVEHLQAAARELIQAARAALDVAEEVVNDPEALASLAGTLTTVGDMARRVTGAGGWPAPGSDPAGGGTNASGTAADAPRVERITVT